LAAILDLRARNLLRFAKHGKAPRLALVVARRGSGVLNSRCRQGAWCVRKTGVMCMRQTRRRSGRLGTTSGQLRSGDLADSSCKRHQTRPLVFLQAWQAGVAGSLCKSEYRTSIERCHDCRSGRLRVKPVARPLRYCGKDTAVKHSMASQAPCGMQGFPVTRKPFRQFSSLLSFLIQPR